MKKLVGFIFFLIYSHFSNVMSQNLDSNSICKDCVINKIVRIKMVNGYSDLMVYIKSNGKNHYRNKGITITYDSINRKGRIFYKNTTNSFSGEFIINNKTTTDSINYDFESYSPKGHSENILSEYFEDRMNKNDLFQIYNQNKNDFSASNNFIKIEYYEGYIDGSFVEFYRDSVNDYEQKYVSNWMKGILDGKSEVTFRNPKQESCSVNNKIIRYGGNYSNGKRTGEWVSLPFNSCKNCFLKDYYYDTLDLITCSEAIDIYTLLPIFEVNYDYKWNEISNLFLVDKYFRIDYDSLGQFNCSKKGKYIKTECCCDEKKLIYDCSQQKIPHNSQQNIIWTNGIYKEYFEIESDEYISRIFD